MNRGVGNRVRRVTWYRAQWTHLFLQTGDKRGYRQNPRPSEGGAAAVAWCFPWGSGHRRRLLASSAEKNGENRQGVFGCWQTALLLDRPPRGLGRPFFLFVTLFFIERTFYDGRNNQGRPRHSIRAWNHHVSGGAPTPFADLSRRTNLDMTKGSGGGGGGRKLSLLGTGGGVAVLGMGLLGGAHGPGALGCLGAGGEETTPTPG